MTLHGSSLLLHHLCSSVFEPNLKHKISILNTVVRLSFVTYLKLELWDIEFEILKIFESRKGRNRDFGEIKKEIGEGGDIGTKIRWPFDNLCKERG